MSFRLGNPSPLLCNEGMQRGFFSISVVSNGCGILSLSRRGYGSTVRDRMPLSGRDSVSVEANADDSTFCPCIACSPNPSFTLGRWGMMFTGHS